MKGGGYAYDDEMEAQPNKKPNALPIWGNEKTMNLNPLILTNIQSSQYFKVNLYQLKTYHEVIDEIYYNVSHLEPWEKGSRKTSGQTGMCGGVRGVGAGGIVSTAFCILYKLFTLRLTRKQITGLLNHADSPYIRGLGFMYIRYTQPPADLWDWMETYLDDEEEIDVRAGGGQPITVGQMVRQMLTKLDWYSTLFPRIPVPIQKDLEKKLANRVAAIRPVATPAPIASKPEQRPSPRIEADTKFREEKRSGSRDPYERERDRERERRRERNGEYERERERQRDNRDRVRHRERERRRSRSRERRGREGHHRHEHRERGDYADLLEREKYRIKKERKHDHSRDQRRGSRTRSPHRERERERRHRH